jgi:hypothetical protein
MASRTTVAMVVLAIVVAACGPRTEPRPSDAQAASESPSAASAAIPQDTAFVGTTAAVQRTRSLLPYAARPVLRAVQAERGGGPSPSYDRVVFEFTGDSVPGYRVEYTMGPVQRCGSGDRVSVAGTGRLLVRFQPAQAHDEQGNPTPSLAARHSAPGLTAVREMTLICDFEGQVEWVLGIAAPAAYRVSELTGPARLVLDVSW